MRLSIINKEPGHLTPIESKHIKAMIRGGKHELHTSLKAYNITRLPDNKLYIRIASKYVATIGEESKWHECIPIIVRYFP